MGRHRSEPMGLARLALLVLGASAVVALLFVGGRALLGSVGSIGEAAPERSRERAPATVTTPATPDATSDAAPPSTARVPTVRIECLAETCPLVTVRVPGGDVLHYRDMSRGEEVSYFEPELDVVLTDAGTVRVTENGEPREQGTEGEREAFTVTSPD
ncbi:hypothetical protein AB0K12_26515 [Nonomuraea sp. NPDC049419]|uniref:hypothetical protein n=1 Tax=Nonomuraea sp. NPDC049419 TaxID=3155772 RepID=UPI003429AEDF